jgi:hypothetical protein
MPQKNHLQLCSHGVDEVLVKSHGAHEALAAVHQPTGNKYYHELVGV